MQDLAIVIMIPKIDRKLAEEIMASEFIESLVNKGASITANLSESLTVTLGGPN